jgi:chromosome segregation ATPase
MPSLRAQLAQVQGRLEEAEKHIEDQIVLIEQLRADRHDTDAAEHFLATLTDLLTKLTSQRNKLEARLKLAGGAALSPRLPPRQPVGCQPLDADR